MFGLGFPRCGLGLRPDQRSPRQFLRDCWMEHRAFAADGFGLQIVSVRGWDLVQRSQLHLTRGCMMQEEAVCRAAPVRRSKGDWRDTGDPWFPAGSTEYGGLLLLSPSSSGGPAESMGDVSSMPLAQSEAGSVLAVLAYCRTAHHPSGSGPMERSSPDQSGLLQVRWPA